MIKKDRMQVKVVANDAFYRLLAGLFFVGIACDDGCLVGEVAWQNLVCRSFNLIN